ncbi:unnamed protein product, partial [marine sediment metagenome]
NDKTSLQVEWIDVYDAVPGRSVKKLAFARKEQAHGDQTTNTNS